MLLDRKPGNIRTGSRFLAALLVLTARSDGKVLLFWVRSVWRAAFMPTLELFDTCIEQNAERMPVCSWIDFVICWTLDQVQKLTVYLPIHD